MIPCFQSLSNTMSLMLFQFTFDCNYSNCKDVNHLQFSTLLQGWHLQMRLQFKRRNMQNALRNLRKNEPDTNMVGQTKGIASARAFQRNQKGRLYFLMKRWHITQLKAQSLKIISITADSIPSQPNKLAINFKNETPA